MAQRATVGVVARSLVFLALVVVTLIVFAPFCVLLVLPRLFCLRVVQAVIVSWLFLLHRVCGLSYEVRGREHLDAAGPCLVASKHQSAFETLALQVILDDPAIVLKRELTLIPVAGWAMWRLGHIAIDRGAGAQALMMLVRDAKARLREGRSVVIFPEGTRQAPGASPSYKPGVAALYRTSNVPCLPVALNSGLYWPRRSLWRFPGTIIVEILPAIPPGLSSKDFSDCLEQVIEDHTRALLRLSEQESLPRDDA